MKKAKIVFLVMVLCFLSVAASDTFAQTVYGISIVYGDQGNRAVDGYSGTWLDYYAGLYMTLK